MSEKKISEKSLANLKKYNQESNQITRESLEISLMQLLEKKELKKITISELVERAGVSRAAFYRNYSSKEQILEEIFKNTVQGITDKLEEFNFKTEMYQIWLFLFKEAKKEARVISLAIDYNFEKLLTQAVFDFLEKRNRNRNAKKMTNSYTNSFWSSAVVSVLSKWIKDGMKVPAEKIASLGLPLFPQKKQIK
ncbi:TetR/AcrR family transcriptional regulator [Streptococcus sp. IsoGale022]|uniref:TetR/AcrR family transcriptional regulator n=1 Tax=Streptococcus sp. IsoGale022 TaxID=2923524 RepID=UPI00280F1C7A|nr:TetR/AcrR family transcriptional regulator [Streptococcus sp. IsoGale022]MDQ8691720.1 TetR/AcrR family transcriptional regulator [Streptococcus sp. IsoGale022]